MWVAKAREGLAKEGCVIFEKPKGAFINWDSMLGTNNKIPKLCAVTKPEALGPGVLPSLWLNSQHVG